MINLDLDNTLIYSYRHHIGKHTRNIEVYEGREISYITEKTYKLLREVKEQYLIVPTSTRTIEQYNRVNLGVGEFSYALVCNGGILLRNGEKDEAWYQKSLEIIQVSASSIQKAQAYLEQEESRYLEVRYIEKLFLFTKCKEPERVVFALNKILDLQVVDVFHNGEKVYVVPCSLSKGVAINRLKTMLQPEMIIAAGDSEFDISMVEAADKGFVPFGFKAKFNVTSNVHEMTAQTVFAEAVLEECIAISHTKNLVKVAKRENNTKRSYLVVNPLQGKHVPVAPSQTLKMFHELADKLDSSYKTNRVLVIGFAETATAIGAQVAISLGTKYIQTTREEIPGVEYLFFTEAHSHATEQKLVKDDIDNIIEDVDCILFVEDEVTTGNTILNIMNVLKKEYAKPMKYAIASLLNGMTKSALELYKEEEIAIHYLVKTDHSTFGEIANRYQGNGDYISMDQTTTEFDMIHIPGGMNARRVLDACHYAKACNNLAEEISHNVVCSQMKQLLIVGTEECMFPSIYVGNYLEEMGYVVNVHATTRSPIVVSREASYPVHERYTLQSVYDINRQTYLYDIQTYDQVLIITDTPLQDKQALQTLVNALRRKNHKITVIRWC